MRHRYETGAVVLARAPLAEAATLVTLLTREFGVLHARAEGLRRPGAKLAHALQTLDRADVILVRGKEAWRLSGATLEARAFDRLDRAGRLRAGRIAGLFIRLVRGEGNDPRPYALLASFLEALPRLPEPEADAAEITVVLRLLFALGLDPGPAPEDDVRALEPDERRALVTRINRGLDASGL